ncbi:MAG TPA: maleylpyruvate isomerase family mycothiol-dependent enzyme [Acidimicrobiia bacterium]|nr:maleylpyruvate isomerase family mycothiol-dependent enzyme [Acidimicrobiia bacterium]
MNIFDDLVAEQDRLEAILDGFDNAQWNAPSVAAGWSVADVILHLAQTEEAVVWSAAPDAGPGMWSTSASSTDDAAEAMVQLERASGKEVFERWKIARRAAVDALRAADPQRLLNWAAAPLKPKTLATTRLAEHWAHGLDVTEPFGIPFPDTARLQHIAWLGHATLPYAFKLEGDEPHEIYCELEAPDGDTWRFGPPDADSTVTGSAGAFCRVGARRLTPEASGLVARGPHADTALRILRNYAA